MLGVANIALRAASFSWPTASADPISRWELDETSGATVLFEDRGAAFVRMTVVGVWPDMTTGSLVDGVDGTSAYTNGTGYATLPAGDVAHDLSALTISLYYQRASVVAKHILFAAGDGSQPGDFSIEVLEDGRLRGWHTGQDSALRFFEGTSGVAGTNLQVGTAHRIDLTLGPQGAHLYLDGVELLAAAIPANINGWNNARVKYLGRWTDGILAPAVGAFDRIRLWDRQLSNAEIATLEAPQSVTLPSLGPPGNGPLINLATLNDHQATIYLEEGGDARYDASKIVCFLEWPGPQGCSSPNRSLTSQQFLFRWRTNNQNGGALSGGAIYSNLSVDDDYDSWNGHQLYPCSDGGQIFIRDKEVTDFLVEGFRFHGCWDPHRLGGTGGSVPNNTPLIENVTIRGSWATSTRDDFCENDTNRGGLVIEDCLIGDEIGGPGGGTFVFLSMRGGSNDASFRTATVRNCLIWQQLMHASGRNNGIGGYVCNQPFKLKGNSARLDLFNNIFLLDHISIAGDPFINITRTDWAELPKLRNSSGNIAIWRDLGNIGSYPYTLPPGFSLVTGAEGEDLWNDQVAAWKTAHPNVRRLNIPGMIVDVG